jgi:hypothetical protein
MSFQFTPDYVYAPDKDLKITTWNFNQDLRQFFPETDGHGKYGNNDIGKVLVERKILKDSEVDTEYSCLYASFKTKRAADAFLKRLNAMPEVKNYVEPPAQPSGEVVILSRAAWDKLKSFLKANMSKAKFAKLQGLELEVWDTEM